MPRLGTPEVSSSHQIQPRVGQFQPTSSSPPVPVFLIQCSSLPHPMLQFQSTSSSAPVPVFLIHCSISNLTHPVVQFQSTSSSAPIPVYLIQCCSSSLSTVQKTLISCSLFLFCTFFFSNFTFFE